MHIPFDNSYARLPDRFYARLDPTPQQYAETLHTYPRIVDAYGMFNGTNVPQGSWVDLTFEYGNNHVTSHVKISTWKPSDGSDWTPLGSQNFFQEAYLTFKIPVDRVNLKWNVGAFQNTYGGLGQYDVGHYNAPIIGSPYGTGETLTGQYDLSARYTLFLEDGFMGRLGKTPVGAPAIVSRAIAHGRKPEPTRRPAHTRQRFGGLRPTRFPRWAIPP